MAARNVSTNNTAPDSYGPDSYGPDSYGPDSYGIEYQDFELKKNAAPTAQGQLTKAQLGNPKSADFFQNL